jgi:LysM repeat protein
MDIRAILEAAKAKKAEENRPEHIIMQLRKVESLRGQKPVTFNDGSTHNIPVAHASRALTMHQTMKPIPKGEFEARLAKSHDSFMSAIKGEAAPKAEPKIKLGGKMWREEKVVTGGYRTKDGQYIKPMTGSDLVKAARDKKLAAMKALASTRKEETELDEAGAFSYGAKKPKAGSLKAQMAAQSKKYWDSEPMIEPKDQKVGTAKVTKEAKDPREYGYEGDMAVSQLKSIISNSTDLLDMMKPETDLPEWVQSKITLAQDYIQTAADYMKTESVDEAVKGWKNAGSDISKWRSEQGKEVKLVALKKNGDENQMADATSSHASEEEAIRKHKARVDNNPGKNIRHNLYVGGKLVKTLGEEAEQIDEISQEKKDQYAQRATGEFSMANYAKRMTEPGSKDHEFWKRKEANRRKGLSRALAKEEAINEAPMSDVSHSVASGQTLSGIAKQYGKSLADIVKANPQIKDINKISIGQNVNVPGAAPTPAAMKPNTPAGPSSRQALGSTLGTPKEPTNAVRPEGPASGMPKGQPTSMVAGKPSSPIGSLPAAPPKLTSQTPGIDKPLKPSTPFGGQRGGDPFSSQTYRPTGQTGIDTASAALKAAGQLATQKAAQQKLGNVRMIGGRTTAGYVNSVREDADVSTTASDRGEIKTFVKIGPDGRVKLVKRRMPRQQIDITNASGTTAVESVGVNMQQDSLNKLKKEPQADPKNLKTLPPTQGNKPVGGEDQVHVGKFSVAENVLLNTLYHSLNEDNKVKFYDVLDAEDGPEKLLNFAKEQGLE